MILARRSRGAPMSPGDALLVAHMRWHDALEQLERVVLERVDGGDTAAQMMRAAHEADPAQGVSEFRSRWGYDNVVARSVLTVFVRVLTVNESNVRSVANAKNRGGARARRTRLTRRDVYLALLQASLSRPEVPAIITMTRVSTGTLDDDGLASALKATQDAVATDYLGLDDRDPRLLFRREQRACSARGEGVEIRITSFRMQ